MKIVLALNSVWFLVNFHSGLVKALVAQGHQLMVLAPPDRFVEQLSDLGCAYKPLHMDARGVNPIRDLLLFYRFWRLLKSEKPDILLSYTIKPNIYGSLAAYLCHVPVVNNITGLGMVFIRENWLSGMVQLLYRLSFLWSRKVFLQNEEHYKMFVEKGLARVEIADRLPGAGVDVEKFSRSGFVEKQKNSICFLLVARMLWSKGVGEYIEAARNIKAKHSDIEFFMMGLWDRKHPQAVDEHSMKAWLNEGHVDYLGSVDDVRSYLAKADCVVLPSFYPEGTPSSLLEAAAMECMIITTDLPGCRDVVDDGRNGYLCKAKDKKDLQEKMEKVIALNQEERKAMGRYGREKIKHEFDEAIVIKKYLDIIEDIA